MATTKKKDEGIRVLEPEIVKVDVEIQGSTELIVHKFSDKARKAIEEKQQKKAKRGKPARDPKAEYEGSMYSWQNGRGKKYGFPANGFKQAMVSACRFTGKSIPMTIVRGAVFVMGDHGDLTEITGTKPYMRTDMVRLSGIGNPADVRYRAGFPEWKATLHLLVEINNLSVEEVVNLVKKAGFHIGVGEWRPERNGMNGMFDIVKVTVKK